MQRLITFHGRPLSLTVSQRALVQLACRVSPLLLEMELYFSCLIRKRVLVRESIEGADAVVLADKLIASFRPVVTETCAMRDVERDNPRVKDMPILHPERFYPHWLTLDYRRGQWRADFGYAGSVTKTA